MIIRATAPTRIDFAGGTLDIPPFYIWADFGVTVSGAINLFATAELTPREDSKIILFSKDLNKKVEFDSLSDVKLGEGFDLLVRLIKFYKPKQGFELTTKSDAPFGSGLGGSSALTVAVSGALNQYAARQLPKEKILDVAHYIEVQNHGAPDGKQELYVGLYGGFNAIWFDINGERLEPLVVSAEFLKELRERTVLCYTGLSRNSGVNNWEVFKRHVEGDKVVRTAILNIRNIAVDMRKAIAAEDISKFPKILKREWENRKKLAKNWSTPEMEKMIESAEAAGAIASKACGAGGGGCMIFVVEKGRRDSVAKALENAGAKILNYDFTDRGLKIEVLKQ